MELCTFCRIIVVDEQGRQTEDYGAVIRGKHVCGRCMRAFEFSLGG
ncbi:MAG: hypothetical protein ABI347_03400 [Nitrososphaera sp.]|jgi:hypothetical protein